MDRRLLAAVFGSTARLSVEADLSDADLLARFAAGESDRESAFAEVVRRHGPLVWAVCRRSLSDPADAEDCFQATFLALVKSPRAVRRGGSLPGWLHGVAVRVAAQIRRAAGRRRRRESAAAVPEGHTPVPDSAWDGTFAAVQDEITRLPASLKAAVVLCDLGRVPHAEAARQLGWKPNTLTGTLARARRRLAARLAERGLAPAVLLAAAWAGPAPAAVPWKLVEAVTLFPNAAAGTIPASLVPLATEALSMGVTHLKYLAAATLVAGGLAVGVGPAVFPRADAQGFGREKDVKPAGAPQPAGGSAAGPPAGGAGMPPGAASTVPRFDGEWDYQFEDLPANNAAFAKLVQARGKDGWEYAGPTVTAGSTTAMPGPNLSERPKLVFKRRLARVYDVSQLRAAAVAERVDVARRQIQNDVAWLATRGGPPKDMHVFVLNLVTSMENLQLHTGSSPVLPPLAPATVDPARLAELRTTLDRLIRSGNTSESERSQMLTILQMLDSAAAKSLPPGPPPAGGASGTAPTPAPLGGLKIANPPPDAAATARRQAELDAMRFELAALNTQNRLLTEQLAAAKRPAPPAPEEPPAVFAVQLAPDDVAALVPVVDAALGRDGAKAGGSARVAAFGRQLIVFGGPPHSTERVAQLLKSLGVRPQTADKPAPPPAGKPAVKP